MMIVWQWRNDWVITLLENNEPTDLIEKKDGLVITSFFNPINSGGNNLAVGHDKIYVTSGQNGSGDRTEKFTISLFWKLGL